jgi:hypothetical protein
MTGITFFCRTHKEIKAHVVRLTDKLQVSKTVPGSHCNNFVPFNISKDEIYFWSSCRTWVPKYYSINWCCSGDTLLVSLKVDSALLENDWYAGCITTHNDEECDILLKFRETEWRGILVDSWSKENLDAALPQFTFLLIPTPSRYETEDNSTDLSKRMIAQTSARGWQYRLEHDDESTDFSTTIIVQTWARGWQYRLGHEDDSTDLSTRTTVQIWARGWQYRLEHEGDSIDLSTLSHSLKELPSAQWWKNSIV